jgi:hypothetical protein
LVTSPTKFGASAESDGAQRELGPAEQDGNDHHQPENQAYTQTLQPQMKQKTKAQQPIAVFPILAHDQEVGLALAVYHQQDHHFEKSAKQ